MTQNKLAVSASTPTILAIGDIHLGTRPSSVPHEDLEFDAHELTPEAALELATNFAIDMSVDAVLFAGDVVESTNARFEALRPLQRCLQRLIEHGIQVMGVAGNHDFEALPRLADQLPEFKLLGAGGVWETMRITSKGTAFVEIVGWSFDRKRVDTSPLMELIHGSVGLEDHGLPRIGLLHCDLGVAASVYAPVVRQELESTKVQTWLLGHIHKPSLQIQGEGGGPSVGYLGSLMGLDPSETGVHGPWLLSFPSGQLSSAEQIPLAPLRWQHISVDIESIADPEDIGDRILVAMKSFVETLAHEPNRPKAIGFRVHLRGAVEVPNDVRLGVEQGRWVGIGHIIDSITLFTNKVFDETDLVLDLHAIAAGDDPPALLAQKIVALLDNGEAARELLDQARARLTQVSEQLVWQPLTEVRNARDPLDDGELKNLLLRAGRAALYQLLAQRTQDGAPP
jgi:hypothetical protein|tara:strand:- start:3889 stop:5250 length:1362 start_codon:yes stop_codon:yes gene_type:complete